MVATLAILVGGSSAWLNCGVKPEYAFMTMLVEQKAAGFGRCSYGDPIQKTRSPSCASLVRQAERETREEKKIGPRGARSQGQELQQLDLWGDTSPRVHCFSPWRVALNLFGHAFSM